MLLVTVASGVAQSFILRLDIISPMRYTSDMKTMELYRNAKGHEVWRIFKDGKIIAENISSDFDAQWIKDNA